MIAQLFISNLAVIQKAAVELTGGLNVFTGETGAGKTVLLSAINAVMGKRVQKDMIRTGETKAVVSALFTQIAPNAAQKLAEMGFEPEEDGLLITREITQTGGSCKINGMPATAAILREVTALLVGVHGQHDTEQLLSSQRHLDFIDDFGRLEGELSAYQEAFSAMRALADQLEGLNMDDAQKARQIDMLTFQLEEIQAAKLEEGEEEALTAQRQIIRNSEKIVQALSGAYAALQGDIEVEGAASLLAATASHIEQASRYIEALEPMAQRLSEMAYELGDFSADIRSSLDDMEFDPRELDELEYRLDQIHRLKAKYGGTVSDILEYAEKAQEELESITTSEQRREAIAAALAKARAKAEKLAATLSEKRRKAGEAFTKAVEQELVFLDMPSVKLSVSQKEKALGSRGTDEIELLIVTNAGEVPKPLSRIASGGELSRIMLAIKNVLSNRDDIDTLIFDEVDSGVSGRAAQKIGQKLRQVAAQRQVLCVTHLAQVASFGHNHLLICKETEKGRPFTEIHTLERSGRIQELARIIGGDRLTDTALKNAEEMLEAAQQASRE
ncbi:DNA repair protein RecN [Oscillospiraceae bacterium MB08-C2-2]|nr:DNA repair protein RecN [Oscillospiraceae bacterium MB08-C2-2]